MRKVFKILLLSLFSISFLFPFINTVSAEPNRGVSERTPITRTVTCNATASNAQVDLTYGFGNPMPGDTVVRIHIDTHGNLPGGDYFATISESRPGDSYPSIGTSSPSFNFSSSKSTADVDITANASSTLFEGTLYVNIYYGTRLEAASIPACTDQIPVSSTPINSGGAGGNGNGNNNANSCTITFSQDSYSPQEAIGYKITGLTNINPDDLAARTGIVIESGRNADIKTLMNTCEKNSDLANPSTDQYVPIHTFYGTSLPSGSYTLTAFPKCFDILDSHTADTRDPKICTENFNVCTDKKCIPAGTECTPDKNICGKDAPFCIENPNFGQISFNGAKDERAHICSLAPSYEQKCNTPGHKDQCNTAIGWFGYSPEGFFKSVVQIFLALGGTILLFTIILNGYRFMASQGDPEKVKEAREAIMSALSGLLLIIFSLVILQFITNTVLHLPGFN